MPGEKELTVEEKKKKVEEYCKAVELDSCTSGECILSEYCNRKDEVSNFSDKEVKEAYERIIK